MASGGNADVSPVSGRTRAPPRAGPVGEPGSVSVVIPVLNDAPLLARLLADLRGVPALQLVVVDGGSEDDTCAVAAAHADLLLRATRGRGQQMGAGVAAAAHDWLWFLHADTRVPPHVAAGFASGLPPAPGWGWFDMRLGGEPWPFRVIETAMNWRSALTGITTGDQGIYCHRDLLAAAGGVPRQPLFEDVELCRRLRRLARPMRRWATIATSARRWERDGIARTVALMWMLRLRYFFGADAEALARRYYRRGE